MKPSREAARQARRDAYDLASARRARRLFDPSNEYQGLAGYGGRGTNEDAVEDLGYAEAQYQGYVRGEHEPDDTAAFAGSTASGWDPHRATREARKASIGDWLDAHHTVGAA